MQELIQIAKGFQTSVNIAYDLNNDDKVRGFIPTMSSLDVIEDVLLSTVPVSTQRARILIGAYGRGKSHIVLVLMSLLFKKDKELFNTLLSKMRSHNPDLCKFAEEYLSSDQKILPIIVRGSSTSLTQSFLSALQQALSEEGFSDLMPETHFKAAITQIETWRGKYPETYTKLSEALPKSVGEFCLALSEYDVGAYEEFMRIYPTLTSGSTFNPFLGFDVVDLYENITAKLRDKGYSGVYVIYDEFSKYLESSIATATNSDIKLLQDFAEKCDRSGDKQMHLMLISHKDIANYIDGNLPKDKVDGWRGVSGRFKHVNLHNNYSQMYEIISEVVKKKNSLWNGFRKEYQDHFDDLKYRFTKNRLLDKDNQEEVDTAVEGCYPLHPISTFILPRLSEKVAQNERTLFTFLSADDKFTLSVFVRSANDGFNLLTPDYIYDYFEPLFRKEPYTSEIHRMYKLTSTVLAKVDNKSLHSRIIKTIALIYIVEQFEKLPPVFDIIVDAFKDTIGDTKTISVALKDLIEKDCIVYLKRSNGFLKIKDSSGVDIFEQISSYIEKNLVNVHAADVINRSAFDSYIYPTAYNDEHDITRYFDFTFIGSKDYWNITDWEKRIESSKSDGVIYALIPDSQADIAELEKSITVIKKPNNRLLFILPKKYFDITKIALEYAAVQQLKSEVIDDPLLNDEYDIYIEDLTEVIASYINGYVRPENGEAFYYYKNEKLRLHRRAQLSNQLSKICEEIFYKTPKINNESINKNILPSVAINSRTKILSGLLANELAPNIGLSGTGQDVSIMRSTLLQTKVLEDIETDPKIQLNPADEKMSGLLSEIRMFFTEKAAQHGGASFKTLYDTLTLHKNGYGLKYGVIPIYIALVLHQYKNNLVILYRANEVKITPELLNDINESPEDYFAILEDWNEEKSEYMARLEEVFSDFVTEREKSYNRFTYLLLAMNRWYLSLPKFTKETTKKYSAKGDIKSIRIERLKFIKSLKQLDINPREFLFEKVFAIFNGGIFSVGVADSIKVTKDEYDDALNNVTAYLAYKINDVFARPNLPQGSLTSVIKDWLETLSKKTLQYLFGGNENKILELMTTVSNDENAFVQQLAKTVTFLRIEDWNNETVDTFLRELRNFKKTVDDYNTRKEDTAKITASYEIIITDSKGEKVLKCFDKTAYSSRAQLLLNEVQTAIDEMGQSITEQEKRQVLMELLEKLC